MLWEKTQTSDNHSLVITVTNHSLVVAAVEREKNTNYGKKKQSRKQKQKTDTANAICWFVLSVLCTKKLHKSLTTNANETEASSQPAGTVPSISSEGRNVKIYSLLEKTNEISRRKIKKNVQQETGTKDVTSNSGVIVHQSLDKVPVKPFFRLCGNFSVILMPFYKSWKLQECTVVLVNQGLKQYETIITFSCVDGK